MSILESAVGWLAPPHCINCGDEGTAFCQGCIDKFVTPFGERCWRCNSLSPKNRTCESCRHSGSPSHVWIATNHDGAARDLLSLYKFGHQRAAAEPIAELMAQALPETVQEYLIVPIPTATSRIRERSFGHSELLAQKLSKRLGLEFDNALRRLDQTRQLGSRREHRLKQLDSSFVAKSKSFDGRRVLLIDDVITTGGTIIAATKTLRAAGARQVCALLFAKRL